MTQTDNTADLISILDAESHVRVHILGRRAPGVLPLHDSLNAEILVETSFLSGRLEVSLSPSDLDDWSQCLSALEAGEDISWLDKGDGPLIRIGRPDGDPGEVAVSLEDPTGSGMSAIIPLAVEQSWLDAHRGLLEAVRRHWPREVVQTSRGAYEWRRH